MNEDPLAQLRDIHLPQEVGLWPPAPGWWIVAAIILASIIYYVVRRYQIVQQNKYRQEAIQQLTLAWQSYLQNHDSQSYLLQLTQLLKRAALTAYPRLNINNLRNEQWLALLDDSLPDRNFHFLQDIGRQLLALPYQPPSAEIDLEPLHQLCIRWLREHRTQQEMLKPSFQPKSLTWRQTHVAA